MRGREVFSNASCLGRLTVEDGEVTIELFADFDAPALELLLFFREFFEFSGLAFDLLFLLTEGAELILCLLVLVVEILAVGRHRLELLGIELNVQIVFVVFVEEKGMNFSCCRHGSGS